MERDARFLVDLHRDLHQVNRELGQHYLVDTSVLNASIEMAGDLSSKHVLEIGCGPGSLTHHLLRAGARVSAIEIDTGSLEHMQHHFDEEIEDDQLNLIEGDALVVEWPKDVDAIVANIPYQISSPLLERMQREVRTIPAVLLVQEEFAERMVMAIPPLDRGPLGLSLWLDYDMEIGRRVPPSCFSPQPRVTSCLIRLEPIDRLASLNNTVDRRMFRQMTSQCFTDRRRKLRNLLKKPPRRLSRIPGWHRDRWQKAIRSLQEHPLMDERPDMLEPEDWLEICTLISMFEI
ncbi:MAG: 16S rRNA (adenine(1518)-N(6)/adenine(1519)-N(6))-dimethyltransferase RsmA [Candidatus Thalassarchaeaceae archaeon]|nr:16S rRNA (adenine(1518)-N(6)/adenine(1519)-N(6))-dimethyltransferase RsmA [Candidatus Thalassarchaeaceae archaeon]